MLGMTISRAFDFQGPRLKVKVTVANLEKKSNIVIALAPILIDWFFM